MLDDVKILETRILALEGLVDLLVGKAIADSGAMVLALEDLEADNVTLPPEHAGNPLTAALHQEIVRALAERTNAGHRRSLRFPRQWKRRPRRG